ncbi:MAG: GMC family oxidoreductase, partial [Candidatus Methylomirabilis sp.]|nr:GMC family oxidoreductase [Deltaproteobacteria bacterium]
MSGGNHYDVIIIGTGAGGGTLAYRLAPTGKRVLLLERGGFLPREADNWSSRAVVLEGKYKTQEHWHDGKGARFQPGIHYYVGGQTKFYGAALLRMREADFGDLRHKGGVSPAWPIGYDELAPYYTEAEHLYCVHGERGEDPTEPKADKPYRFPAIGHEPRIQELHDDWTRMGLQPFHLPVGVKLDERDPERSECIRCATCDGFPCLVNAKADAHTICVEPARRHPNVTLLTHALVRRLETDASGRAVTKVVVERGGEPETYTGGVVVVSAGAVNSAALLLRSANEKHPRGLANGSDQVGRNYMCHNNSAILAISKRKNPTKFQKTIAVNDFYFGSREWDHPMGHISMVGKTDRDALASGAPGFAPGKVLEEMAEHSIDFWLTSEDLPDPDNRVTLNGKDEIMLRYKPNNTEAHDRLTAKLKDIAGKAGVDAHTFFNQSFYLGKKIPLAGVAHQCGTARFGRDPRSSVLDADCKAHELDNLYVVDASFFVSSSAVNPALTIMANALRVG